MKKKWLTASVAGGIEKMKKNNNKSKKVQALLYSTFKGNQEIRYGTSMEAVSIHQNISHNQQQDHNFRVEKCGLFIS